MVDVELLNGSPSSPLTRGLVLSQLLQSDLVRIYRYQDDGPPASVAPRPAISEASSLPVYDGWAVAIEQPDEHSPGWLVTYAEGPDSWSLGAVIGNAVAIAAGDDRIDAYRGITPAEATKRRRADGLAAQVASQAIVADVYVTERDYLHAASWDVARGVALCRRDEALPLVGLYLRAQGDYRIASNMTCNSGLFYLVATRELLPAGWRWFAACMQHSAPRADMSVARLAQSLFQRVGRALEARDRLHIALNQPQHNDIRREILARLDDILVDLMGAVDVSARVAHRVLGLPADKEYIAAWQKESWVKQITSGGGSLLSQVVAKDTAGRHTLTVLRLLRNSVHGTALESIAFQERSLPQQSLIAIDEGEVVAAMDELGGTKDWGAQQLASIGMHADPGAFVDKLFPLVVALLNDLMTQTPVEQLSDVHLTPADHEPPTPSPNNTNLWDEGIRTSIRWQLGFSDRPGA